MQQKHKCCYVFLWWIRSFMLQKTKKRYSSFYFNSRAIWSFENSRRIWITFLFFGNEKYRGNREHYPRMLTVISETLLRSFILLLLSPPFLPSYQRDNPLFAAIPRRLKPLATRQTRLAAEYTGEDYRSRLQEASTEIKLGNWMKAQGCWINLPPVARASRADFIFAAMIVAIELRVESPAIVLARALSRAKVSALHGRVKHSSI